jgi:threonine/homoserine/homoserine lactone efflux protein
MPPLFFSVVAFTALKIVSAVYLACLAWQAFRASASKLETTDSNLRSVGAIYRRGIIMHITNPKVTIFFLAFLPQLASLEHGALAP